ncbi:GntR family transcriptional regulator [Caulobacter segnis]|uniref:GntR family transcriptional regulator n=1 Tax=Caulobacter segnis TaxID=88688 RepID=UPI0026CBF787|nr:GntR family transcriptional regulator [Caulobacter segnis]
MSRDRDPFERALEAIRIKLRSGEGLQGRALAINLLARELGVSQTPVREALAWLAGEGLVVRGHAGYVGRTFDGASLAELYRLNLAHVLAALSADLRAATPGLAGQGTRPPWPLTDSADPNATFDVLVAQAADRTLLASLRRTREPLSPFVAAEAPLIGDQEATMEALRLTYPDPAGLRRAARAFYRRRVHAASMLFSATLERLQI